MARNVIFTLENPDGSPMIGAVVRAELVPGSFNSAAHYPSARAVTSEPTDEYGDGVIVLEPNESFELACIYLFTMPDRDTFQAIVPDGDDDIELTEVRAFGVPSVDPQYPIIQQYIDDALTGAEGATTAANEAAAVATAAAGEADTATTAATAAALAANNGAAAANNAAGNATAAAAAATAGAAQVTAAVDAAETATTEAVDATVLALAATASANGAAQDANDGAAAANAAAALAESMAEHQGFRLDSRPIENDELFAILVTEHPMLIPAGMPGWRVISRIAATAEVVCDVKIDNDSIGTITTAAAGTEAVCDSAQDELAPVGSLVRGVCPAVADATWADIVGTAVLYRQP